MSDEDSSKNWVWVPDKEELFLKGYIKDYLDDQICNVSYKKNHKEIIGTFKIDELDNCNPSKFNKCSDMAELTHLNEPSVIYNLNLRYGDDLIYTYSGLYLVAINPYKSLPIYDIESFNHDCPHIYSIANATIKNLMKNKKNQSILVTGESGAGKTENTKKIIQFFSYTDSSRLPAKKASKDIDQRILQANPIMESFGNAKTTKNNNSSRFGKFIKIYFNSSGGLIGGHINYYLLEKSRVISQLHGERNFHIFYQFLKGYENLSKFSLNSNLKNYKILRDSGIASDSQDFKNLIHSFEIIGLNDKVIYEIYNILAIILHVGNIEFVNSKSDRANFHRSSPVPIICKLLNVDRNLFEKNLLKPKIKAGKEFIERFRTPTEAKNLLDSLCKLLYENLFSFIIDRINDTLTSGSFDNESFIGVLDIAGFEIFEVNSFEQLCINYTNEKLQQFFNHHLFILEQSEYLREDIKWDYIDFGQDLQPTIELIENVKPMGVLKILDEECLLPNSTDKSFLDKLLYNFDNSKIPNNNHNKFRANKYKNGFIINHYAGEVEYNVDNWLDKNNDPINEHLLEILRSSSNEFIAKEILKFDNSPKRNKSLSMKYKQQLIMLMDELNNTEPHFVRCILPNLSKKPNSFDKLLVLNQLRCNGVLEGIRITRAGYPNKIVFEDFYNRYAILNPKDTFTKSFKTNCEMIIKSTDLSPESYKIGIRKIFFKNGILGKLEELRDLEMKQIFTNFQSIIRGKISRTFFKTKINRIQSSQTLARNFVKVDSLKMNLWYLLFVNIKPLLEDSIKVLNSKEINENLKSFTLKLKESEKLNKNHEIQNAKLSETIADFQDKIIKNELLIEEKSTLIEELKKNELKVKSHLDLLNSELKDSESKNELLQDENHRLLQDFETLNSQYGQFSSKYDELLTKFNDITTAYENLKSRDADFELQYQKEKANHEKSLSLLKTQKERYDQLKLDHKTLKKNYDSIEYSHNNLEQKHVTNLTKIDDLNNKYQVLLKEFEALNSSNVDLTNSINSYKTSSSTLKAELSKLRNELNGLTTKNTETLNNLTNVRQEIGELKAKIKALTSENESLTKQLSGFNDMERNLDEATKTIQEINNHNENHQRLIQNLSLQISNLKRDNSNYESKISKITATMDSNERSKKEYSNKIIELNSHIEKLKLEITGLKHDQQQKENQPPVDLLKDYGNLKLKCNELAANLRLQKFENSKLTEEIDILKNKIHISPYSSPRKSYRNSMQLGEDLSIIKGNNLLIKQIEDLKLKLEQEEINSTRAENYAIELQKKLNKLQTTRGINSTIDFEKKYKESQTRVSELESKFEKLFDANSPSSGNSTLTKSESFGRSSFINKTLENANQDFVKIYHDITKTLKSTREELTSSKLEILRLKSLLRESEDELYLVKRENFKTSVENYENELASLKVKQDNLIERNNDLLKSVELYKSRSDEYFKKLELAESAIKISKRHEDLSQRELIEIKNEYKLLKEELKTSEGIIKKLNNDKEQLVTKIKDKDHEISLKIANINDLNDKISYNKKVFENQELVENYKQDIQNLHNELNFKLENQSKLVKENKQLKIDNEVLLKKKTMLEEDYEAKLTRLEETESTIDELSSKVRVLENEKAINQRKLFNNDKQIQNLKQLVNDVTLQRDELLAVKERLEEDNLILNQVIEEQKIRIDSNEANLSLLRTHLESTRMETNEIQNELNRSKLSTDDDIINYQQLKRENLVVVEENDSLKRVNKELKTKVDTLEHKLYNDEQVKYWEAKMVQMTKSLDSMTTENFNLNKLIGSYESEIKNYKIKNTNDAKLIKQYNEENFKYKSQISHFKSNLDILHDENLEKDLKLKSLERENSEVKNTMLLLEKEVLQLRAKLN